MGGSTWQLSLPLGFGLFSAVAVDPLNTENVYAVGAGPDSLTNVYRSTDGGQTWSPPNPITFVGSTPAGIGLAMLAIDAISTNNLYLNMSGGLGRSVDYGQTWSPTGLSDVWAVNVNPYVAGVVYASTLTQTQTQLFKSTDFGATWTPLATNLNLNPSTAASIGAVSQIAVDPQNSSTLYAAVEFGECSSGGTATPCGIFKSIDGGNTWQALSLSGTYTSVSVDRTETIYAGGSYPPYTGFVAKSADGGKTWTAINSGLTISDPNQAIVFVDPATPSSLYVSQWSVGSTTNGVFRSSDSGASWVFLPVVPALGQVLSFGIPLK
jgi:photosystem II stability/assembly factor-like uncharacterized protein